SQPDRIVPATSKIPTSASKPAAVVDGIPWSWAAVTKCVPTRPLVVAPQMANPPASSQNVLVLAASRSMRRLRSTLLPDTGRAASSPSVAPYAVVPTSLGWSRISSPTSVTTARAARSRAIAAPLKPYTWASAATNGRRSSCPVAPAAVSPPLTKPRRFTTQRPVIVATNGIDIEPVPTPTSTPQHNNNCHGSVMNTVSPAPAATSTSAQATTRRIPNRSINAAANGEITPNNTRLIDTAEPIVPWDQPNSSCNGSISTL